jgi:CBS domain-containing protein
MASGGDAMKVKDVMTAPAVTVPASASCKQAAEVMRDHATGTVVVTGEAGVIEGIITDRDLVVRCMALGRDPAEAQVADYYDRHPVLVDAEADLEKAVEIMRNAGVRRLPVTDGGVRLLGMLSLDDVAVDLRHYVDAFLAVAARHHLTA